jgi:iron complex outermembrane receptor protein
MRRATIRRAAIAVFAGQLCNAAALAASAAAVETLAPVVITATRSQRDPFDVPAAVQTVTVRRDSANASLADSLAAVPGLIFRDRENRAQETQVSIRGFGARSTFGIRGVRVLIDEVPASQPDGQGQISQFDLSTAERIEVLRGPFSALYGNSSGGVLQLFSSTGRASASTRISAAAGPAATRNLQFYTRGAVGSGIGSGLGEWRYSAGASELATDGVRGHSAAQRDTLQALLALEPRRGGRLQLSFNALRTPDAQDPLGLTSAQFASDPWQSAPVALQFDTRKSTRQNQLSILYDTPAQAWGSLRLMAYSGARGVVQYLAIPVATQADARHSGGVVNLVTGFGGGELRWTRGWQTAAGPLQAVVGVTLDRLSQQRRGYENFLSGKLGVAGALRRDEDDTVRAFDQYAQLEWSPLQRALLMAGVRHSEIRFRAADRYIRSGNPDDSGSADYGATVPVASALWRATDRLHFYTALGQGFETPTLVELAYRTDGRAGLNFDLSPARTRQVDVGLKFRDPGGVSAELALFRARTERELVVAINAGGRAAYANAGRTEREGIEVSAAGNPAATLSWQLAYTALRATVLDTYNTCSSTPCTVPNARVAAGNRLAGVPASQYLLEFGWHATPRWRLSLNLRGSAEVPVDDLNSQKTAAWQTVNLALSYERSSAVGDWHGFVRADNLADRHYAGSVIVNDANGRYYEAAPGRTLSLGVELRIGRKTS